ncbi:hypothetical protein [Chamaesiphon sp. OTE_8_metabat_110]|uniref:hypothetical protein n=1 Tax=Chamaesiphon sp. OTE_8_metabat_110 TaxID=2964696 RepID=UPI00286A8454|nr:hypothetical protein [Chamaesiphon sp. OTE_8_metabat_110]
MFSKQQALEFAKKYHWTVKDAERAFKSVDLKQADELALLTAMAEFAGKELLNRQYLQRSQKGQVTKKTQYIKEIELDFAQKTNEYEKVIQKQHSLFVRVIAQIYNVSKTFGVKDPWVETLLSEYEEYLSADKNVA